MREILIAIVLFMVAVIVALAYCILCEISKRYQQRKREEEFQRRWATWGDTTNLKGVA